MTDRAKRLRALLRVAGIREKQAEAAVVRAEQDRRTAEAARSRHIERLAEVSSPGAGTVASLDAKRQQADLRIDAVVQAGEAVDVSLDVLAQARKRWQDAARQRRSLEELDNREKAVQAVLASRAAERAMDDVLRARRREGTDAGEARS